MSKISIPLTLSLMIVSCVLGWIAGYASTSEYQLNMYDKTAMDLGRPDRTLDLRYLNAMIAHHREAMLLAAQASAQTQRQEIKSLSTTILEEEPKAIAELYAWKKEWYKDVKQVKDPIAPKLGAYDEKFDLRFLNALITHHEDGLLMTKEVRTKTSNPEVLNNADAVDAFLIKTLQLFKEYRKQWYNI